MLGLSPERNVARLELSAYRHWMVSPRCSAGAWSDSACLFFRLEYCNQVQVIESAPHEESAHRRSNDRDEHGKCQTMGRHLCWKPETLGVTDGDHPRSEPAAQ